MPHESGFLKAIVPRLMDYLAEVGDRTMKTIEHGGPAELTAAFREGGADLELDGEAHTEDQLMTAVELILKYSVRTGSPYFMNQLYSRADETSIAGDFLLSATNTNAHTYEVAPAYTMIERAVLQKIGKELGAGWEDAQGLAVPGGSFGNMYGLILARHRVFPDVQEEGLHGGPRLVAFVSDQSHYSYLKSCKLMGIGSRYCVKVPTDEHGRLRGPALLEAVKASRAAGQTPFFVGATTGTTVLGAHDAFEEIAEVCKAEKLWMHVDGAWGGALQFSPKHRHSVKGMTLCDSFAWNPHKMIGATLPTSVYITRHSGMLRAANATNAAYLFQPDKENTEMDFGDMTIQCGRRPDLTKLWLMWKQLGDAGIAARVDECMEASERFAEKIEAHPNMQLVYPTCCANVCFWWLPSTSPKPFDPKAEEPRQNRDRVHRAAASIKKTMQHKGQAMIGFQAVNNLPNFFRIVFPSKDGWNDADTDKVIADLDAAGKEWEAMEDGEKSSPAKRQRVA